MDREKLASALCDSSSHLNLMPHAEQRPCAYHRKRAEDALRLIQARETPLTATIGRVSLAENARAYQPFPVRP